MGVMKGLLKGGEAKMRATSTQKTSWTYCKPTNATGLELSENIIMIGVQGDVSPVVSFMNHKGEEPIATVRKIKDVRGQSLASYLLFNNTPKVRTELDAFKCQAGDFNIYMAKKVQ